MKPLRNCRWAVACATNLRKGTRCEIHDDEIKYRQIDNFGENYVETELFALQIN